MRFPFSQLDDRQKEGASYAAILICMVVLFSNSLNYGFVNWDDEYFFSGNPLFSLPFGEAVVWSFGTWWQGLYQPISWLLLYIQKQIFGFGPFGLHCVSLALHAANCVLAFRVARSMRIALVPCLLAALLLGVHPLRVENIAWASAQAYLWAAFFSLLATLAVIHGRSYGLVVFLFFAAITSKATPVTLPLVWMLVGTRFKRWQWGLLLLIAAIFSIISYFAARIPFTGNMPLAPTWTIQIQQIFLAVGFVVEKLISPTNLSAYYPSGLPTGVGPSTFGVLWAIATFCLWKEFPRVARWMLVLPLLCLPHVFWIRVGHTLTADRYSYVPLWAWVPGVAWGLSRVNFRGIRWSMVALIGFLSLLSWEQVAIWSDSESRWRSTLAREASSTSIGPNVVGLELQRRRKLREAEMHLRQAIRIKPDYARAYHNLGVVLLQAERYSEALWPLLKAKEIDPEIPGLPLNLGVAYAALGQLQLARKYFAEDLRLRPEDPTARSNWERTQTKN